MSIFSLLAGRQEVAERQKFSKLDDLARYVSSLSESSGDLESEAESVEAGLRNVGATREALESRVRQFEKRNRLRNTLSIAATAQAEIDRRDTEWRQIDAEQEEAMKGFQARREVLSNGIEGLRATANSRDQARRELLEGCQDFALMTREKKLTEELQELTKTVRKLSDSIQHKNEVIEHNEKAVENNGNYNIVDENDIVLKNQKQERDRLNSLHRENQNRIREINTELDSIRELKLSSDF